MIIIWNSQKMKKFKRLSEIQRISLVKLKVEEDHRENKFNKLPQVSEARWNIIKIKFKNESIRIWKLSYYKKKECIIKKVN